ncbi:hypothetical protein [Parvibaculum sp.]|jgi:glycosyltransferase involved in cell wall biosynthesis|uniref:hypothetical protein n=1 Tax=Parvibaculum sp. TaxID=2024848 RepID=UPI000C5871D0|nr:hypothetical protein [Parvibaculum sp.]MAM94586.1 hypothetical protein [Parvibaculum sp.]|tara:strand:+ start:2670 stop:3941 length:1272 start_codon:yes stop_codon:yes gene_type:complete
MHLNKTMRLITNVVAFVGRNKEERNKIRRHLIQRCVKLGLIDEKATPVIGFDFEKLSSASSVLQDMSFPREVRDAERLIVVMVPEHDTISGGIYSMFSIASHLRKMKREHGYEVIVMTRPQEAGLTYFRNTNFLNSENVYRFSMLQRCSNLKELYLHIPEYTASNFFNDLSKKDIAFLLKLDRLKINLLNQNIKLMPAPEALDDIRALANDLTQSVAHHSYFSQEIADTYNLPTLLLPAYTDLSAYPQASYEEKEKLIIYSPDNAPHKKACLKKIKEELPDFELVEIRDITFDRFMDLATRCMFSITFGEGFDGYLAQPIHQGGLSFSIFEEEFFPSGHFLEYQNIFASPEEMTEEICARMLYFQRNPDEYKKLNRQWIEEYEKLYSYDDYCAKIRKLAMGEFEIFPLTTEEKHEPRDLQMSS